MIKPFSMSARTWTGIALAVLVALGALLRWWGVNWPPLHPDEWTWRIVEHISHGHPYFPFKGLWHQALFMLLGLCYWPVSWVVEAWQSLVGPAGAAGGQVDYLLYGRVMVGLLSALNAWAAYSLLRRAVDSRTGALAAALLIAVCPLLVAQAHYHTVDAPLALAVTLCLIAAVNLYQQGRWWDYLLCGLAAGITITTKVNALVILGPVGLAVLLRNLEHGGRWPRSWLLLPLVLVLGLAAGLIIGYPGFIFGDNLFELYGNMAATYTKARYSATASFMESPLGDRLAWSALTFGHAIGWEIVGLYLVGLALALWRRQKAIWIIGSYPLLFYFPYVFLANRMAERDLPSLVPSLVVVAVFALVFAARRWLPAKAAAPLVGVVALGLALSPLMTSARVGYLFWQRDTRHQARDWIIDTLEPDALVFYGRYSPEKFQHRRGHIASDKAGYYRRRHAYLVHSSTDSDREYYVFSGKARTRRGQFFNRLDAEFQKVKVFDLKARGPQDLAPGRRLFPIFASPELTLYSGHKPRVITQPLPLVHPTRRAAAPYFMSYTNHGYYSLDDASAVLTGRGRLTRVLRTPAPLVEAEVEIINLGKRVTKVKFSQGPWPARSRRLYPGQIWRAAFQPTAWPWFVGRVYPFTISAYPVQPVLMRLFTDPLVMGWRALERGEFQKAAARLRRAVAAHPQAVMPRALLAAALLQSGDLAGAQKVWPVDGGGIEPLVKLAESRAPRDQWLAQMASFTGYYPDLLLNALTRRYRFNCWPAGPSEQRFTGMDYSVMVIPLEGKEAPGSLTVIRLHDYLPPRDMQAEVVLSWRGSLGADGVKKVMVWMKPAGPGPAGQGQKVELKATDLSSPTGRKTLRLAMRPGDPAQRWSLHLRVSGKRNVRVESLKVTVEPRALLFASARWVLLARGRLLLAADQLAPAAKLLARLAALDPGFTPALKPQVRALLQAGRKDAAAARLKQALPYLDGRVGLLAWGADLAAELNAGQVKAAYDQALAAHRAPHRVGASFANGMRLRGYDISSRRVPAGGTVKLRLVWDFTRRPQRNITVFTHLVGPGGRLNYDHFLDHGRVRMDRGRPGRVVVENLVLKIPPKQAPGAYELEVGMYWGKKRQAVTAGPGQGGDILRLGKVEVTAP